MTSSPPEGPGIPTRLRGGSELRFTLLGDRYTCLSACVHGPSGRGTTGDVHCGVHISVGLVPAGDASEHRLVLTAVRCAMPASTAGLRRVRRSDPLDPTGRLVLQPSRELPPSAGKDASVQSGLRTDVPTVRLDRASRRAGQGADLEVLDPDRVEPAREVGTCLLDPVLPSVRFARFPPRDRGLDSGAAVRATPGAAQTALQPLESRLFSRRQAWAGQQFPGREGGGHGHAAIHANDRAGTGGSDRRRDNSERNMPAPAPVTRHAVRLRRRHGARQPELHPTDLRHQHSAPLPVQLLHPLSLRPSDPESFMHAFPAPARPAMRSCVEVPPRLVEVAQCLLLHHLRTGLEPELSRTGLGELRGLRHESRRRGPAGPPHQSLLKAHVPHVPRMPARLEQPGHLIPGGSESEARHGIQPIRPHRQFLSEGRELRIVPARKDGVTPQHTI